MRKQYHFWPGESGLDAWDVDRLIELSRALPVEEVEIASIEEADTVYWFDEVMRPTVRAVVDHARRMQKVDTSYPIILSVEGRVMDGMHRIARAMLEDEQTVKAVRFLSAISPDYRNCSPQELPY